MDVNPALIFAASVIAGALGRALWELHLDSKHDKAILKAKERYDELEAYLEAIATKETP